MRRFSAGSTMRTVRASKPTPAMQTKSRAPALVIMRPREIGTGAQAGSSCGRAQRVVAQTQLVGQHVGVAEGQDAERDRRIRRRPPALR